MSLSWKIIIFLKSRRQWKSMLECRKAGSSLLKRIVFRCKFLSDAWNLRDFQSHKFPFIIIVAGKKGLQSGSERQYFIFMMPPNSFRPFSSNREEIIPWSIVNSDISIGSYVGRSLNLLPFRNFFTAIFDMKSLGSQTLNESENSWNSSVRFSTGGEFHVQKRALRM